MHWFVEIARLGHPSSSPTERHCVEADSWRDALLAVRRLLSNANDLGGMSIEVLAEGVRAVDPRERKRFTVTKAPDDAPLTISPEGEENKLASQPPVTAPTPSKKADVLGQTMGYGKGPSSFLSSSKPAASSKPTPSTSSPSGLTSSKPVSDVARSPNPAPSPGGGPSSLKPTVRRPSSASNPEAGSSSSFSPGPSKPAVSSPKGTSPTSAAPESLGVSSHVPQAPRAASAPATSASPAPQPGPEPAQKSTANQAPAASSASATPASRPMPSAQTTPADQEATMHVPEDFQTILERSEDPTEESPIAYREVAYALAPGTDEQTAAAFLLSRFELIRSTLAKNAPGKLINLAVFDHVFTKKPKRPPLVTLVWKDWKSKEPEIRYPHRPGQSIPPASLGPGTKPVDSKAPTAKAPHPPTSSNAPSTVATSGPPTVQQPSTEMRRRREDPTPLATPAAIRAGKKEAEKLHEQPPVSQTLASAGTEARAARQNPPASAPAAPAPAPAPAPAAPAPTPLVQSRRTVPSADFVADIFEAMHDLYFLRTPGEGADFVLSLVLEKFHATVGIVQLYDINRREFVVMSHQAPQQVELGGFRTSESDPLLREIMQHHTPFIIDAGHDPRTKTGRWKQLGVEPLWLLVSSIQVGGRFLGTIELALVDPGDEPFGQAELDALSYVVERFAEFIVERGLVFSGDAEEDQS